MIEIDRLALTIYSKNDGEPDLDQTIYSKNEAREAASDKVFDQSKAKFGQTYVKEKFEEYKEGIACRVIVQKSDVSVPRLFI